MRTISEGATPLRRTMLLLKDVAASTVICGGAYAVFARYRPDYLGHFLAGLGGTFLIVGVFLGLARYVLGWEIIAGAGLAIAVGAGLEATIFRLAFFDPLDFINQSLGAVLAAIAVSGHEGGAAQGALVVAAGVLLVGGGFYFAFL